MCVHQRTMCVFILERERIQINIQLEPRKRTEIKIIWQPTSFSFHLNINFHVCVCVWAFYRISIMISLPPAPPNFNYKRQTIYGSERFDSFYIQFCWFVGPEPVGLWSSASSQKNFRQTFNSLLYLKWGIEILFFTYTHIKAGIEIFDLLPRTPSFRAFK